LAVFIGAIEAVAGRPQSEERVRVIHHSH
jgi:hypothetical protein